MIKICHDESSTCQQICCCQLYKINTVPVSELKRRNNFFFYLFFFVHFPFFGVWQNAVYIQGVAHNPIQRIENIDSRILPSA